MDRWTKVRPWRTGWCQRWVDGDSFNMLMGKSLMPTFGEVTNIKSHKHPSPTSMSSKKVYEN